MAISAEIYITLQKIIMFAQARKLDLLRGGRGLEEPMHADEPQLEDIKPSAPPVVEPPKLIHTDEALPSPTTQQLPAPQSIKDILSADSEQLSLEEVLHAMSAADETQSSVSTAPPATEKTDEKPADEQPSEESQEQEAPRRYTLWQRFQDWRAARRDWNIEKWRKDYEYACHKQQIKDMCEGYDEMIAYVKKLMYDWDEISAEDNIDNAAGVTLSGIQHDGI